MKYLKPTKDMNKLNIAEYKYKVNMLWTTLKWFKIHYLLKEELQFFEENG